MTEKPGYSDTPQIPGQKWRVHDPERPLPQAVTPGTPSTQDVPGRPPSDAFVLFDGTDLAAWEKQGGGDPGWRVEGGYMEVVPESGGIQTREHFGDSQFHLEWAAPVEISGESQGRGNSGVFLMGRYEIQVLDAWDNPTYADGTTASVYGQYPPRVLACRQPGEWQMYDIVWVAPRFDGEKLASPARLTLFHNGVLAHHDVELNGPTGHRDVFAYEPHPPTGPLALQDHGDRVRYRNIWCRPIKGYDAV